MDLKNIFCILIGLMLIISSILTLNFLMEKPFNIKRGISCAMIAVLACVIIRLVNTP